MKIQPTSNPQEHNFWRDMNWECLVGKIANLESTYLYNPFKPDLRWASLCGVEFVFR